MNDRCNSVRSRKLLLPTDNILHRRPCYSETASSYSKGHTIVRTDVNYMQIKL